MPHFIAEFTDGTIITQTPEDTSTHVEGKNAFYDVLQRLDDVLRFSLIQEDGTRLTTDLSTGHFEVNGVPFFAHDQNKQPQGKLKLIYFKEMHQNFHQGVSEPYEIYCNKYYIGWEDEASRYNENSPNNKTTISIKGDK